MDTFKSFETLLPTINAKTFDDIALRVFSFQAQENALYRNYIHALRINPKEISRVEDIPFLPIQFFKNNLVKTADWKEEVIFTSSGTTGQSNSQHAIHSVTAYYHGAQQIFESAFGSLRDYHLLALLPSYLERENSSLVAMIGHFIKQTESSFSGFYLHNQQKLVNDVARLKSGDRKIIVWGVTYALLDVAENFSPDWSDCLVFETGGMKGKRAEITRENLHTTLKNKLNVTKIHSEYGMTELLSQAYTRGGNLFIPAQTMKIIVRDVGDPFRKGLLSETGGINVIDLSNIRSIAFIETEDLGKVGDNGFFEVLGRLDNADSRGCNLLVE